MARSFGWDPAADKRWVKKRPAWSDDRRNEGLRLHAEMSCPPTATVPEAIPAEAGTTLS